MECHSTRFSTHHLYTTRDKSGLESVQRCAARWACGSQWDLISRTWSKSSDDCLNLLCWPSLADRHSYLSVSTLYDIFSEKTSFNFFDYYNCNTSSTRAHKLSIVPIPSSINSYRHSFFVNTVFLWNTLSFDMLNIKSVRSFRRAIYHHFCA